MSIAARIAGIEERLEAAIGQSLPVHGELISIILPTRNRAGFIGAAIASVQGQTYQDWELLIIDDGSTDDTEAVVAPFLADRRITYRAFAARGAAAARNAGLALARGALIAYLNSGNAYAPRYLSAMAAMFGQRQVQSAYAALLRDDEESGEPQILFQPFTREALVRANFIDINVFAHRRSLYECLGGFDENLQRMIDWDLILRYTETTLATPVPVIGAYYHINAPDRISTRESFTRAFRQIRAKSRKLTITPRPIRVLYAVPERNRRIEIDIETEIAGLRGLGVEIVIWAPGGDPYASAVPLYAGALQAAIAAVKADVVHVHGLREAAMVAETTLPVTIRATRGEVTAASLTAMFALPNTRNIYVQPRQYLALRRFPALRPFKPAFNTERFFPELDKSKYLVFAAATATADKDFSLFLRISKLLPDHLFVLALLEPASGPSCLNKTRTMRDQLQAPATILRNVPHNQVANWMAHAAIYLHVLPDDTAMKLAIAEAMASGCHILLPAMPGLAEYPGEAGTCFNTVEDAARHINAMRDFAAADWARIATRAADRAGSQFCGDDDFFALREHWAEILLGGDIA